MKRNFAAVAQFLQQEFPHDLTPPQGQITGDLYPAPSWVDAVSQILQMLQLAGLVWMLFGGEKVCLWMGYPRDRLPAFYYTIQQNATPILFGLYLLIPQMLSSFQATGAFEVYLIKRNDHHDDQKQPIFSKLQRGAFPTAQELVDSLVAAGLTPGRPHRA